jgi:hypothetical protein
MTPLYSLQPLDALIPLVTKLNKLACCYFKKGTFSFVLFLQLLHTQIKRKQPQEEIK